MSLRVWLTTLLATFLFACVPDPEEVARLDAHLNDQIEIGRDIVTYYSDSARIRVVIKAPTLENILDPKEPRKIFPDGLRVTFLDELSDTTSILTARHGIYFENKNEVIVTDSVVWRSLAGQKLETDELIWRETDARIQTDRFVVITQPDYIIHGYGLDASQDFKDATIRQVTGRFPINRPAENAENAENAETADSTNASPIR